MSLPGLLAIADLNLKWGKVIQVVLSWALAFGCSLAYLLSSRFTSVWTSLLTSLIISVIFAIGFGCSIHFRYAILYLNITKSYMLFENIVSITNIVIIVLFKRCTVAVFPCQLVSHPGLLMNFVSMSWFSMEETLEDILGAYESLGSPSCNATISLQNEISARVDIESISNAIGFLHYGALIPYFCTFVYAFGYEFSYFERTRSKTHTDETSEWKHRINVIAYSIVFCVVGGIAVATLYSAYGKSFLFGVIIDLINSEKCKTLIMNRTWWATAYPISCAVLGILACFSYYVLKARRSVIAKFFTEENAERTAQQPSVLFLRSKEQRVPVSALKRQPKAANETTTPEYPLKNNVDKKTTTTSENKHSEGVGTTSSVSFDKNYERYSIEDDPIN